MLPSPMAGVMVEGAFLFVLRGNKESTATALIVAKCYVLPLPCLNLKGKTKAVISNCIPLRKVERKPHAAVQIQQVGRYGLQDRRVAVSFHMSCSLNSLKGGYGGLYRGRA